MENKNWTKASGSEIRGRVVVTDEEGNQILDRDNMIVSGGRSYISGLVSGAIAGTLTSSTKKISKIKFGTGTTVPASSETALVSEVAAYETTLGTTLVWKKSTANVSEGLSDPGTVVVGDYFYNTTSSELKLGTAGTPDTWVTVSGASGGSFPTSPTPSEDDVFYRTDLTKLYVYTPAFTVSSLSSPFIGLLFSCTIRGIVGSEASISELGLFTDTPAMFSRLAFDPIPLTEDADAYNISYYVYF